LPNACWPWTTMRIQFLPTIRRHAPRKRGTQ
jgi:hypothetical protein